MIAKRDCGFCEAKRGAEHQEGCEFSVPASLRSVFNITQEQLREFESTADAWLQDPKRLTSHLQREALIHLQIVGHVVKNPPKGRSGANASMRMAKVWYDMANDLLAGLKAAAK